MTSAAASPTLLCRLPVMAVAPAVKGIHLMIVSKKAEEEDLYRMYAGRCQAQTSPSPALLIALPLSTIIKGSITEEYNM